MTLALLPYLDFVFRKEEGGSARTPVLHKSGVGNHLIVHSGKCNGGQEIITQLYQPAACEPGSASDKQPACAWGPPACPGVSHPSMNNDIPSRPGALRMHQRSINLRYISQRRKHSKSAHLKRVWMTDEMMRGPPLAPSAARRRPSDVVTIIGDIELCGFLNGRMKLARLGGRPYVLA